MSSLVPQANVSLVTSLQRAVRNKAMRPLLLAWALDGLALAVLPTLFPYYIDYFI